MPTGAPPSTAILRALTLVIAIMVLLRAKSVTDQAGDCPVLRGLCKPGVGDTLADGERPTDAEGDRR